MAELGISRNCLNGRGGARAFSHPIGASKARTLVTLLHAMEDADAKRGVATICIGSGEGTTIALERNYTGETAMSDTPRLTLKAMLQTANAEVTTVSAAEAILMAQKPNHLLVDLRDIRELARDGRVEGALHCPRGLLEFWIAPESPYHKEAFAQRDTTYVLFCAGGLRSALAAKTAQDMGLERVVHIEGGFGAWVREGGPVAQLEVKS